MKRNLPTTSESKISKFSSIVLLQVLILLTPAVAKSSDDLTFYIDITSNISSKIAFHIIFEDIIASQKTNLA